MDSSRTANRIAGSRPHCVILDEPRRIDDSIVAAIDAQLLRIALAVEVLDAPPCSDERYARYRRLVGTCGSEHAANVILTPLIVARAFDAEGRTL